MMPRAAPRSWMGAVPLLILATCAAALPGATTASSAVRPDTTVAVDSSQTAVRRPPDSLLTRFERDSAFDYEEAQGWTWWTDLRRWAWAQLYSLLGDNEEVGWMLRAGFYAMLALIIGYAAYMLVRLRSTARAPVRAAPSAVPDPTTPEEMRAVDFSERLETTLEAAQYRRAVRLLYLHTLQRLDQAGAITWRPSTTNRTYVDQLDGDARSTFADLTRLFERIWYGGAAVDAGYFERVRDRFEVFWEQQGLPDVDASPPAVS